MPTNARRKLCIRRRDRNDCQPDVVVDPAENVNLSSQPVPNENATILFKDSHKQSEKEHKLHLKVNLKNPSQDVKENVAGLLSLKISSL